LRKECDKLQERAASLEEDTQVLLARNASCETEMESLRSQVKAVEQRAIADLEKARAMLLQGMEGDSKMQQLHKEELRSRDAKIEELDAARSRLYSERESARELAEDLEHQLRTLRPRAQAARTLRAVCIAYKHALLACQATMKLSVLEGSRTDISKEEKNKISDAFESAVAAAAAAAAKQSEADGQETAAPAAAPSEQLKDVDGDDPADVRASRTLSETEMILEFRHPCFCA
jgi:hypothetical protein